MRITAIALVVAALALSACSRDKTLDIQIERIPISEATGTCLGSFQEHLPAATAAACVAFEGTDCVLSLDLDSVLTPFRCAEAQSNCAGEDLTLRRSDWHRLCPSGQGDSFDLTLKPGGTVAATLAVMPSAQACAPGLVDRTCDGSAREPDDHASCLAKLSTEFTVAEDGKLLAAATLPSLVYSGYFREELGRWGSTEPLCPQLAAEACDTGAPSCGSAQLQLSVQPADAGSISGAGDSPCTGSCSASFPKGRRVTLAATAAGEALLGKWSGGTTDCTAVFADGTASASCTVIMQSDASVSAQFGFPVSVELAGGGRIHAAAPAIDGSLLDCMDGHGRCAALFAGGANLELLAEAGPGGAFVTWEGDCSGAGGASCMLAVDRPKSARAVMGHELVLHVNGDGRVTAGSDPPCASSGGTADCRAAHRTGETVELTAVPAAGSTFVLWSGACSGRAPSCSVRVDATTEVTALFGYEVHAGAGGPGTVLAQTQARGPCSTPPPAGETCGAYVHGQAVEFDAVPAAGARLLAWSGACAAATGTQCNFSVTSSSAVHAEFIAVHQLAVSVTGSGIVSAPGIACARPGSDCTETYDQGTPVHLVASADPGWSLGAWSGDCTLPGATSCDVIMDRDRTLAASFGRRLDVSVDPGGTVVSDPAQIDCSSAPGSICSGVFADRTTVVLHAMADRGWAPMSATGCSLSPDGTCSVLMNAAQSVHVTFGRRLSVEVLGQGSVVSAPAGILCGSGANACSALFADGDSVTLTATASAPWRMLPWTGDCAGLSACTLPMDGAHTATAAFALECTAPSHTYSSPALLPGANETFSSRGPSVPSDGLSLYFSEYDRTGHPVTWTVVRATRTDVSLDFDPPAPVSELGFARGSGLDPAISPDGLEIFFAANPVAGTHLYCASRSNTTARFSSPIVVSVLTSTRSEGAPVLSWDGLDLYYATLDNPDLLHAHRDRRGSTCASGWTVDPIPLLAGPSADTDPALSADGLELYFVSDRQAATGGPASAIWVLRRAHPAAAWSLPEMLMEIEPGEDAGPALSADACELYFDSLRPGGPAARSLWHSLR